MTAGRLLGDGLISMAMLTFLEVSTWRYSIQLQIWFIRATCRVSLDKIKGSSESRAVSPPKQSTTQLWICFDLLVRCLEHIPQMVVGWWFTMVESVKKHFKQIQDLVGFHLDLFSFCERDDLFGTIPAFISPKYFTKTQKEQPSINHSISITFPAQKMPPASQRNCMPWVVACDKGVFFQAPQKGKTEIPISNPIYIGDE